ncbi:MAG: GTP 3',8-cyclase MoaA [Betaproteobacteria bacterium]|nr:GTP 3',8-cyclase MoaA [Betaproteobacteria bacterium]MDE2002370.1 GTP 3',8-cyclase MoaA [Betaproteobacteria bacterium]MDE2208710.1 GTP 3',8-cyclase MoaA [Betaproteobacteria bacterium]
MSTIIPLTDVRNAGHPTAMDAFVREAADAAGPAPELPVDTLGRHLHDLRISVTDRCNFRCVYCMPKDVYGRDFPFLPHADLLSFEEIARIAGIFLRQGVRKIRLTGGEPLLRRNLERLVEMLASLGDVDLTLTTNGALLARKARALRDAGLRRVTVSLDALDDPTFRAMNDVDFPVQRVLEGIDAAQAAGLAPIKINAVIKRGLNEHAIVPLARHFRGSGHIVRFIEYMDVGHTNGWRMEHVVSAAEIVAAIAREFPLEPAEPNYTGEVAERWRYRDNGEEIGVIASVTQAFCRDCTRARLSTEGRIYTCLFASAGYDLRALLRENYSDDQIGNAIAAIWRRRADRYSALRSADTPRLHKVEMSYIGG